MNHEYQLAELLRTYGADPARWPKEHRSIVPENEWPEAVKAIYAEEQMLDHMLKGRYPHRVGAVATCHRRNGT